MTGLVLLALVTLSPSTLAGDMGCMPGASPAIADDLAVVMAVTPAAPAPPVKDEVHANHYDRSNGDNDGDGVRNKHDALPNDARDSTDKDGDGVGDNVDAFPDDPKEWRDSDCDGVGDNADKKFDGKGRVATVSRFSSDGTYGQNVGMTLVTTPDGVIHAILKVKLTGARDGKREAGWENEIEKFWSNDEFSLDVQWVESGEDNRMHVRRGSGRENSGTLFTSTDKWTAIHEFGHLLGLDDEYQDRKDPARLIGESNSIMRISWEGGVPYKRHLALILSQFDCEGSRAATEKDLEKLKKETPAPRPEARLRVTPSRGKSMRK